MSQQGEISDSRSPPGSPQLQVPPGIRRATSQWSEHHNAGTSYFPPTLPRRSTNANTNNNTSSSHYPSTTGAGGGRTDRRKRRSAPVRSASLASSSRHGGGTGGGAMMTPRRGTGVFSEADEDADRDRFDDGSEGSNSETDNADDQNDEDGDEGTTPRIRGTGLLPDEEEDPVTLKERQSLINDEHPFGLPIWKPALYRKSRGITREAEFALHGVPVPSAARDLLLPGNIAWTIFFGWWLALAMLFPSLVLSIIPWGGNRFAPVVYGLGWYLFWPFGRYVEGELPPRARPPGRDEIEEEEERPDMRSRNVSGSGQSTAGTVRGTEGNSTIRAAPTANANGPADVTTGHTQSTSWNSATEHTSLLPNSNSNLSNQTVVVSKSYGTLPTSHNYGAHHSSASTTPWKDRFAKACYYYFLICNIAPLLLVVCTICWACVFTIPMAKLTWELLIHMFVRPESIRFCSAPKVKVASVEAGEDTERNNDAGDGDDFIAHEPTATGTDARTSAVPSQLYPATPATLAGRYTMKRAKLRAGQLAPSGNPDSTVLLCIYRAVGAKYYKYTVGGVNILFVNLIPIVFFVIFDGIVLLPLVEKMHHHGEEVPVFLDFIAGQATIFLLCLASVIPLSYFIGMAVASISAQSSIGMGAVINATFGSIIEIILYGIALTQGKGRLVEGSIVGSILAGVLLMPGMSMCSSALRRKEQVFNAKSASVTSTMLIMAIFGTLTPTLFYHTYGNFQLVCAGCPDTPITVPGDMSPVVGSPGELTMAPPWTCKHCYYSLPDPVTDPFYQDTVKPLMYFCASILVFSYLIGLWFSLRTHASQIWQNPRQLMEPQPLDLAASGATAGTGRMSLYHRLLHMPSGLPTHYRRPESLTRRPGSLHRKASVGTTTTNGSIRDRRRIHSQSNSLVRSGDGTARAPAPINTGTANDQQQQNPPSHITLPPSPSLTRRVGTLPSGVGYTPIIEHVTRAAKAAVDPMAMNLQPPVMTITQAQTDPATGYTTQGQTRLNITTDEFTRAVAVATVSALRQGAAAEAAVGHARRVGAPAPTSGLYDSHHSGGGGGGGHGGHDAPSWSRAVSATVLLSCTLLYAIIAEILVDVVDVVLKGSGIDEKLLGVTIFALVPNTTEFMNAMSFALNGNISLSMEIGSAYALQVCLLQIPAMVAFSAWYDPRHMGTGADTFTLIFPRWDVIAIILSIFLLTYTYIEAKSNYHRGSILILSYLVMASGFYFAPNDSDETRVHVSTMAVDSARPYLHIIKTYAYSLFSR